MILKYTMAMAGHCIYDDENKCFATSIIADFGTVGDSVSLSVPSDRIKTYVYYSWYPNESYSKESDYAFINYKLAIGQLTGTIGVDSDTVCVGDTVWVTGYPSDLGNCKYMYKGIGSVESVTDSLIKYDADTYRGQSGSPVYYKSGGKLYSYATHIYGGNYGRRLSSGLMTWLYDNGFLKWGRMILWKRH